MKGDGDIRKVRLRFIGVGYNNRYQARIMVYDINNNLVFDGNTYNGVVELKNLENGGYRVVARFLNEVIDTYFYANSNSCEYIFPFNHAIINVVEEMDTVNFLLTDQNYNGLAIERGELILWQR